MANVASIYVSIVARTNAFTKGMVGARATLLRFGDAAESTVSKVLKLGAALGTLAGAAGLASLVKGQAEAIDTTGKLADRLGSSIESLVGLQHAASLSGVSLEQLTTALQRIAAKSGGGDAVATFAAVADRVARSTSAAEQARIAFDAFGKSGVGLLNVLKLGSTGLKEATADAKLLGLTFSQFDFRQVERANDAITRMRESIKGLANIVAIQIAPFVQALANKLTDFFASLNTQAKQFLGWVEAAAIGFAEILRVVNVIRGVFNSLVGVLGGTIAGLSGIVLAIGEAINKYDAFLSKLAQRTPTPLDLTSLRAFVDESTRLTTDTFDLAGQQFADAIDGAGIQRVKDFFTDIRTSATEAARAAAAILVGPPASLAGVGTSIEMLEAQRKNLSQLQTFAEGVARDVRAPFEVLTDQLEQLFTAFEAGMLTVNQVLKASDKAFAEFDKATSTPNLARELSVVQPLTARQIDLARIAVPGVAVAANREQKVTDTQLKTTNQYLQSIDATIRRGTVAVAG